MLSPAHGIVVMREHAQVCTKNVQDTVSGPVVTPAFVVRNWGDHNVLSEVTGKEISKGKAFRIAHIRKINQYDLMLWLEIESCSKIDISMNRL